jgi:hypothetical protein
MGKRTFEESFSHCRSKPIVVEVRRIAAPAHRKPLFIALLAAAP